ncbi:MAG TPA: C40 family peptidase [Mucilaginibacter sp.]|jgi:cell wall-associated NlpC family hydrolase|nr:C40 family peptidase [Mucilaginibacter sp.]
MKRSLALTVLLLLWVLLASTAFAHKTRHTHKAKTKVHILSYSDCNTDTISPYNLLYFAQSLIGIRYRDASSDPAHGFDCSGFVSYVFKSFNAVVPRSSSDYAYAGREINIEDARPGDVILFKGTKSHHPHSIGHIGIVYSNESNELKFIHSTSGKEYGVTISSLDDTYKRRFVKVVRLLRQNDNFQAPIFQAQVN